MAEPTVKHGGCFKCGSKDEPILQSVLVLDEKFGGKRSVALCSQCRKDFGGALLDGIALFVIAGIIYGATYLFFSF